MSLTRDMVQAELFAARGDGLEARFWRFVDENPQVYAELVNMARQAKATGSERIGIKMMFEVIRWRRRIETRDPSGLKLNNSYASRMARLLMRRERCSDNCQGCDRPECLVGLFELRSLEENSDLESAA